MKRIQKEVKVITEDERLLKMNWQSEYKVSLTKYGLKDEWEERGSVREWKDAINTKLSYILIVVVQRSDPYKAILH